MVLRPPRTEAVGMSESQSFARLDSRPAPARVVIAGGGVAAVETLLALRDLAGERISTTVVAPQRTFTSRPMAGASAFARGRRPRPGPARSADELLCASAGPVH